jgi:dTDP-4-dehydrorhamnose reductase
MTRVLVTGASGLLGRDMAAACERRGHEVFGLGRRELDIRDGSAVAGALRSIEPDVVVNCAAWTDVDGAEGHEAEAMRVNDEAAAMLAAAAARVGASIVLPSSDYVFDGRRRRPYVESDLPNPLSAYGRSKLGGETSVAVANRRHFIVRSSWMFGTSGPNFVETMLQIAGAQPEVLVVSDQVGCPTYSVHLAAAVALLIEGTDYGIHHLAAAGSCSWYELAREIFDSAGEDTAVLAATSEMLGRAAARPANGVLRSERAGAVKLPHWRRGLAAYMAERGGTAQPLREGVAP